MTTALRRSQFVEFLESIKFSHTIFALPFALIATLLARGGQLPQWNELGWIVLAMVGARTWAMGVNRIVDHRIDAKNPRTATRALPAGKIPQKSMLIYCFAAALLFLFSAFQLSLTAFYCAVPVLMILASYSYTKRFTFLCHFWLGLCLGLAPLAAWVALRDELSVPLMLLSGAICFWVAGFDIIYALQDEDYDRTNGLHSIPARFGTKVALRIARTSHLIAALSFCFFGIVFDLGIAYFSGLTLSVLLMTYEHWLVRKGDLNKINVAFFNLNGWIAVILLIATSCGLFLRTA